MLRDNFISDDSTVSI